MIWNDKMLARLGDGIFKNMMFGGVATQLSKKPIEAVTASDMLGMFAMVMAYMKSANQLTDSQLMICVKAFCLNVEKGCRMSFDEEHLNDVLHVIDNYPQLNFEVVNLLLDPVLDVLEDDQRFIPEPLLNLQNRYLQDTRGHGESPRSSNLENPDTLNTNTKDKDGITLGLISLVFGFLLLLISAIFVDNSRTDQIGVYVLMGLSQIFIQIPIVVFIVKALRREILGYKRHKHK